MSEKEALEKNCYICNKPFKTTNPRKKYCSDECKVEGNRGSQKRYQDRMRYEGRLKKERKCVTCGTALSIYNDQDQCSPCAKTGIRHEIWLCPCHGIAKKQDCTKAREIGWYVKPNV